MTLITDLDAEPVIVELPPPIVHKFSEASWMLAQASSRIELLASNDGKQIEDSIWNSIEELDVDVLSLDVFDTLLLRNNKPEAQRYLELSGMILDRLKTAGSVIDGLETLTPEDLCVARSVGMSIAYRTSPLVEGCAEGKIEEAIRVQLNLLNLDKSAEELFLQTEINYEADNLVLNPVLQKIISRFREAGGSVILISDMYLGSDSIGTIIDKVAGEVFYDKLYSSADLVVGKRCGKVFKKISKELNKAGEQIIHLGDDWTGDVQQARKAGWNALYFPVSEKERYERKQGLADFVAAMDEKNIETRSWAKV